MNIRAIGLLAAGIMAISAVAAPTRSEAHPILIPIIIGAVIVGGVLAVGAANAANHDAYHRGSVSVGPDRELECHTIRVRSSNGSLHRHQVCN